MVLRILALVALTLTPLSWTLAEMLLNGPGPDPVARLEHLTGQWTLNLLLATLAVRPLWRVMKWRASFVWLRRTLGLMAFFYACAHLAVYFIFDLVLDLGALLDDLAERPFILAGMTAWLLLVPLAVTSTTAAQRRLGRHWARLHKLVYVATALGIVHYLWLVKKDLTTPLFYLALFAGLMLWRSAFLHTLVCRFR